MRQVQTFNIKSGSSIAAGTHEGCVAKVTDGNEVDLAADSGYPAGIIESIDDNAGTCTVVRAGECLGRLGAAFTAGTSVPHLTSAGDSQLDPGTAGDIIVATALGSADGADGELIPVHVNIFQLDSDT